MLARDSPLRCPSSLLHASPALSALAGLPSSLSVSGLPTLEEAAMELGDMGLSSSDLLAGVGESSGKLAHLG